MAVLEHALAAGLLVAALVCCGGSGGPVAAQCKRRCAYEDSAIREMARDIEQADVLAACMATLEIKDDSETKRVGKDAGEKCMGIHTHMSHARGIAWALGAEQDAVDGRRSLPSDTADVFEYN